MCCGQTVYLHKNIIYFIIKTPNKHKILQLSVFSMLFHVALLKMHIYQSSKKLKALNFKVIFLRTAIFEIDRFTI